MENKEQNGKGGRLLVKPCTRAELAAFYDISPNGLDMSLFRYRKEVGYSWYGSFSLEQVKTILEKLGIPEGNRVEYPQPSIYSIPAWLYINAAWDFARAILWPDKPICKEEIILCKDYLNEYFTLKAKGGSEICLPKRLSVLCQRILFARLEDNRILFCPSRIPDPALWFNNNYPKGIARTLTFFKRILRRRKQSPYAWEGLAITGDLYCEYMKTGNARLILYQAKHYLESRYEFDLLEIFTDCINRLHADKDYTLAA